MIEIPSIPEVVHAHGAGRGPMVLAPVETAWALDRIIGATDECWNPEHLFAGTRRANIMDARSKGRMPNPPRVTGERQHLATLTDDEVAEIRGATGSQRELAAAFGCVAGCARVDGSLQERPPADKEIPPRASSVGLPASSREAQEQSGRLCAVPGGLGLIHVLGLGDVAQDAG